jgi:hypothetical protein
MGGIPVDLEKERQVWPKAAAQGNHESSNNLSGSKKAAREKRWLLL